MNSSLSTKFRVMVLESDHSPQIITLLDLIQPLFILCFNCGRSVLLIGTDEAQISNVIRRKISTYQCDSYPHGRWLVTSDRIIGSYMYNDYQSPAENQENLSLCLLHIVWEGPAKATAKWRPRYMYLNDKSCVPVMGQSAKK
jgi:hypothetical protein